MNFRILFIVSTLLGVLTIATSCNRENLTNDNKDGWVINGDENAFNIIVEKYRKSLISFVYKLTKDIEVAEDITQEVFVYIYKTKKDERLLILFSINPFISNSQD